MPLSGKLESTLLDANIRGPKIEGFAETGFCVLSD